MKYGLYMATIAAATLLMASTAHAGLGLGVRGSGGAGLGVGGAVGGSVAVPDADLGVHAQADDSLRAEDTVRATEELRAHDDLGAGISSTARTADSADAHVNGNVRLHEQEVQMPAKASVESRESLDSGVDTAVRARATVKAKAPGRKVIPDHSTGLDTRADAGEGAVGGDIHTGAAMGSGARMKTQFNQ